MLVDIYHPDARPLQGSSLKRLAGLRPAPHLNCKDKLTRLHPAKKRIDKKSGRGRSPHYTSATTP